MFKPPSKRESLQSLGNLEPHYVFYFGKSHGQKNQQCRQPLVAKGCGHGGSSIFLWQAHL